MAVPLAGATPTAELSFASPAQFAGKSSVVDLSGILLVFDGPGFSVDLVFTGDVSVLSETEYRFAANLTTIGEIQSLPVSGPRDDPQTYSDLNLHLESEGPGSLYVAGKNLRIATPNATGQLMAMPKIACPDSRLSSSEASAHVVRADAARCIAGPAVLGRMDGLQVTLAVDDLARADWHGLVATCKSQACPDGGNRTSRPVWVDPGHGMDVQELRYLSAVGKGNAVGAGPAGSATWISDAPLLRVDGEVRLPEALASPWCPDCDGRSTFKLTGNLSLALAATPEERFQAHADGDVLSALHDERPFDWPHSPTTAAAAAFGLTVVVLAVKAFLLALRIRQGNVLDNPRRRHIFDAIKERPGLTNSNLCQATGVPRTTLLFHLTILQRSKLIVAKGTTRTARFFENHGKFDASWKAHEALAESGSHELVAFVGQVGSSIRQTDLVDLASRTIGLPRSTVQRKLSKLVKAGLLNSNRVGGVLRYSLPPPGTPVEAIVTNLDLPATAALD